MIRDSEFHSSMPLVDHRQSAGSSSNKGFIRLIEVIGTNPTKYTGSFFSNISSRIQCIHYTSTNICIKFIPYSIRKTWCNSSSETIIRVVLRTPVQLIKLNRFLNHAHLKTKGKCMLFRHVKIIPQIQVSPCSHKVSIAGHVIVN